MINTLVVALEEGNLQLVQQFVSVNNVNRPIGNETALHYACSNGHVDVVLWLLKLGARANLKNGFGFTPLERARFHPECIQALLDFGADASIKDTPYEQIVLHGTSNFPESTHLLLSAYPIGVLCVDNEGCTPLTICARYGNDIVCRVLLDAGSDVNHRDLSGKTSLEWSLYHSLWGIPYSYIKKARLLLDYGAKLENVKKKYLAMPWIEPFVNHRNASRKLCLAMLFLKRMRAKGINKNGRDVLRIVSHHIWSRRLLYELVAQCKVQSKPH